MRVPDPRHDDANFLVRRHRPEHARRTAERWAAFFFPHLRSDMRLLDVGCGPGSITSGLTDRVIGLEVDRVAIDGISVAAATGTALPLSLAQPVSYRAA